VLDEAELERRVEAVPPPAPRAAQKRERPHRDDKILTDWNGLMIAALAKGAQVLGDESYALAALDAAHFVMTEMRTPEGRLLHRYRGGDADITATADDYAFFIWGLIELYGATFDPGHLEAAMALSGDLLEHFWDSRRGGFFFTPDDGETLIVRKKEVYDGALPSGNAVAMLNFLRLGRLTGKTGYDEKAAAIMRAFSGQVGGFPSGYTQFLCSLDFAIGPSSEVVVAGPSGGPDTAEMLRVLRTRFIPNHVALFRPSDKDHPSVGSPAEFTVNHVPLDGKATAYVCRAHACLAPTTDVAEMIALMESP
jgi:uncharacterized protein